MPPDRRNFRIPDVGCASNADALRDVLSFLPRCHLLFLYKKACLPFDRCEGEHLVDVCLCVLLEWVSASVSGVPLDLAADAVHRARVYFFTVPWEGSTTRFLFFVGAHV